jgi:iron complex transport system ATP-binding protein
MGGLLHIEHLSVGHRNEALLRDFSMSASAGELIGLTGRNGTGKTTLLKTICGLVTPLEGKIHVEGKDLLRMTPKERARFISIVLTQRVMLRGITVKALVEMGRYPVAGRFHFRNPADPAFINDCLAKLGILHLADKALAETSDGELQKAMIARALAQETPILLMDEPTAFLDYVAKEELFVLLRHLAQNERITVIFSSHDLALVHQYADRVIHIEPGTAKIRDGHL